MRYVDLLVHAYYVVYSDRLLNMCDWCVLSEDPYRLLSPNSHSLSRILNIELQLISCATAITITDYKITCVSVSLSVLSRSQFVTYFWRNLAQTSGTWNERTLSLGSNPLRVSPTCIFTQFSLNGTHKMQFHWECWNLKHFSDVVCGPIITVERRVVSAANSRMSKKGKGGRNQGHVTP